MEKGRLEAFTDGVMAIIITIMVLELKTPHAPTLQALAASWPVFLSYVLSFVYIGIYWNNHHHILHAVRHVNGKVMWANLHLLFWLSLFPFTTRWIAETHGAGNAVPAAVPTALYGVVLLLAALAWMPLTRSLITVNGGPESALARALGHDWKTLVSVVLYALGIAMAFFVPIVSCVLYATVAALWLIPDRRIENKFVH